MSEGFADCDKRYGSPVHVSADGSQQTRIYHKADYEVVTSFAKGKVVEITYRRIDRALLSVQDLRLFLYVNSGGARWKKVDQVAEWRKRNAGHEDDAALQTALMLDLAAFFLWFRDDAKAEASYDRQAGVLLLVDSEYLKAERVRTQPPGGIPNPHGF